MNKRYERLSRIVSHWRESGSDETGAASCAKRQPAPRGQWPRETKSQQISGCVTAVCLAICLSSALCRRRARLLAAAFSRASAAITSFTSASMQRLHSASARSARVSSSIAYCSPRSGEPTCHTSARPGSCGDASTAAAAASASENSTEAVPRPKKRATHVTSPNGAASARTSSRVGLRPRPRTCAKRDAAAIVRPRGRRARRNLL